MRQSKRYLLYCLIGIALIGLIFIPLIEIIYSLFQEFFKTIFGRVISWSGYDGNFAFLLIGLAPVSLFFYLRAERIRWRRVIYANMLFLLYLNLTILLTGFIQSIWFKTILLNANKDWPMSHLRHSSSSPFDLYWTLSMFVHVIIGNITVGMLFLRSKRKEESLIDNEEIH